MANILANRPQFAESFGQGLGSTLGAALNTLAQQKIQSLFPNQFVQSAEQAGIPGEIANFLQYLSPQERTAFFQRIQPGDFNQTQQQAPLAEYIASEIPQQSQQPQQQQLSPILDKLNPMVSPQEQFMRDIVSLQKGQQQKQQQSIAPLVQPAQPVQPRAQQPQQAAQRRATATDILSRPSPGQEAADKRLEKQFSHAEKLANRKENKKYIDQVEEKDRATKQDDMVLKRVIAVREGGKARIGALTQAMKKIGVDFEGLKDGDTLELEKLGKWFLRGGAKMFGGKVSNAEMQTLLSQVPNELQTDEGAIRIANQMLLANEYYHDEAKAVRDIIKENNGEPPWDLRSKVAERLEPMEQNLADKFIRGETAFSTKSQTPKSVESLPSAKDYPGAVYQDEETGKKYKSDGSKWTVV